MSVKAEQMLRKGLTMYGYGGAGKVWGDGAERDKRTFPVDQSAENIKGQ